MSDRNNSSAAIFVIIIFAVIFFFAARGCSSSDGDSGRTQVKGYTKKDGTHVRSHSRKKSH